VTTDKVDVLSLYVPPVRPNGLIVPLLAVPGFVETFVFVDVLPFQHQQAASLFFIRNMTGRGTGEQGEKKHQKKTHENPPV
jgi:hypothetical protein